MAVTRGNTTSRAGTGNATIPANPNRSYFFIIFTGVGGGTVEFNNGGGLIPVPQDGHYAPHIAPIGEISIVAAGAYVIHEG